MNRPLVALGLAAIVLVSMGALQQAGSVSNQQMAAAEGSSTGFLQKTPVNKKSVVPTDTITNVVASNDTTVFDVTAYGAKGDAVTNDVNAIQAAINAAIAAGGGTVYFPPTKNGYGICSANLSVAAGSGVGITFLGGGPGVPAVTVLPGCKTPPQQMFWISNWDSTTVSKARISFENMRIDGYCLAKYNIYNNATVGLTFHNSILRNVAVGGTNYYQKAGYETYMDFSNRLENINDAGRACYSAGSQPSYNVHTRGTDSHFGAVAVNASIANFYQENGGNNDFSHAHGWGYAGGSGANNQPDLRPQYTYKIVGRATLVGSVADHFKSAGFHIEGDVWQQGGQLIGATCVAGGGPCIELDATNGKLKNWVVTSNNTGGYGDSAIKVLGTLDSSNIVANNIGIPDISADNTSSSNTSSALTFTSDSAKFSTFVGIGGVDKPLAPLQVGSDLSFAGSWPTIGFNTYSDGRWRYMTNNSAFTIGADYNSDAFHVSVASPGGKGDIAPLKQAFIVNSEGNVGVGVKNPTHLLQLSANDAFKPGGGSWGDTSDARLKTNVAPVTGALDKLIQLRGVTYDWINPQLHGNTAATGGFIAQEVAAVFPSFVSQSACQGEDCALVDASSGSVHTLSLPFVFDAYVVEGIKEVTNISGLFKEKLTAWLSSSGNGLKSVQVEESVCIGDTCLSEADLQKLLAN